MWDRLVQEGYLRREAVAGDRRKTLLIGTEKARSVVERGREVQNRFLERLLLTTRTKPSGRRSLLRSRRL